VVFHVLAKGEASGDPLQRKLTPEQEATLEPLRVEYKRAAYELETARKAYEEAFGRYVVETRRILGEIP
jgi:archaellum biogenesis protein FlaJ (TadC family)